MRKKQQKDVMEILGNFQHALMHKPSQATMLEEVRMMKFKVRPTQGDVASVNLTNSRLIEALWSLGKLDEIFQKEYSKLPVEKKEVFYRIFENMYKKFQSDLNNLNLHKDKFLKDTPTALEMEIFKEKLTHNKVN
ncbi:MAG: hypothetical protein Q7R95_08895 [bacterium]|nr:hypothetical protein [bacterium]